MLPFVVILDIWEKNIVRVTNFVVFFFNTKLSESEDEGVNRAVSLLSAFKTIVITSTSCQPKIIFYLKPQRSRSLIRN